MKILIESLQRKFDELHKRSTGFIKLVPNELIFKDPRELRQDFAPFTIGEYVLRSVGRVEQTFGGITTRLWDDPFEWTLPEELLNTKKILEYLAEVETAYQNGFAFFTSDEDLKREIPAPEKLKSIFDILLETICRAEHLQGRAFALFQLFSNEKLPLI